jgi:uncharacterized Zn-finger protein
MMATMKKETSDPQVGSFWAIGIRRCGGSRTNAAVFSWSLLLNLFAKLWIVEMYCSRSSRGESLHGKTTIVIDRLTEMMATMKKETSDPQVFVTSENSAKVTCQFCDKSGHTANYLEL